MDWNRFESVLKHTRAYFILEYHGGTREMVYRYVCRKMGDVPLNHVGAALKILKKDGAITYEKKVWWFLADK